MVSIDTSAPSESCRPSIHSIACRSLHVPPGELPHRTHTIYTPTNTPPRGRWRPLSSRTCSIDRSHGGHEPAEHPASRLVSSVTTRPQISGFFSHVAAGQGRWCKNRTFGARPEVPNGVFPGKDGHTAQQRTIPRPPKSSGYRRRSRAKPQFRPCQDGGQCALGVTRAVTLQQRTP